MKLQRVIFNFSIITTFIFSTGVYAGAFDFLKPQDKIMSSMNKCFKRDIEASARDIGFTAEGSELSACSYARIKLSKDVSSKEYLALETDFHENVTTELRSDPYGPGTARYVYNYSSTCKVSKRFLTISKSVDKCKDEVRSCLFNIDSLELDNQSIETLHKMCDDIEVNYDFMNEILNAKNIKNLAKELNKREINQNL